MPQYIITAPDGTKYNVTAPEGATKEDALAQIQAHHDQRQNLKESDPAQYDPESKAYQDRISPVEGNSFLQNALIGSGKFFTDMALGAKQMYGQVADTVAPRSPTLSGLITGQDNSRTAQYQQEAADKRAIDAPVMATGGGKVGQIGTGILTAIPASFIPGANGYAGATAIGGLYGAATPTVQGESRLVNTGVGAGLGLAGQYAGNKIGAWLANRTQTANAAGANVGVNVGQGAAAADASVTGAVNVNGRGGGYQFGTVGADPAAGLTEAQQQALAAGRALGMRSTPGQETGSRALQQLEAKLESQPMTSGPFNAIKSNNQEVVNRAWAGAIGENSRVVDSNTLNRAADRLGDVFERVRSPDQVVVVNPEATQSALNAIESDVAGLLPGNASIRSNPLVENFETLTNQGAINAEQLGSLSSKLGRAATKQMTSPNGDRDWGMALAQVKEHVDDLLQSTLSGDQQAEYAAARQQYRAFMQLTARQGNVNPSTGNVNPISMANYLQKSDKRGFLLGRNQSDAYNAVRFGQAFKPIVGDSGTATRSAFPGPFEFAVGVPLNLATRAYLSSPAVSASAGAAAASRTVGNGAAAAAPYLQRGLPGLSGVLVPYITQ